jgi:PqqD family protein of HPr-rel-A system
VAAIRYRARAGLRRRHWPGEEECVVLHPLTGDTHVLGSAAAHVLDLLATDESSLRSIVGAAVEDEEALLAEMQRVLDMLEEADLVEPVEA